MYGPTKHLEKGIGCKILQVHHLHVLFALNCWMSAQWLNRCYEKIAEWAWNGCGKRFSVFSVFKINRIEYYLFSQNYALKYVYISWISTESRDIYRCRNNRQILLETECFKQHHRKQVWSCPSFCLPSVRKFYLIHDVSTANTHIQISKSTMLYLPFGADGILSVYVMTISIHISRLEDSICISTLAQP